MKFVFTILTLIFFFSCNHQKVVTKVNDFDADLDGIHDVRDECPLQAGSIFNLGCPSPQVGLLEFDSLKSTDIDLDGIQNEKDNCPLLYGSPFNIGCPYEN